MKLTTAKIIILVICLLFLLCAMSTYEAICNAKTVVNNLPKQMVEYIEQETGYDASKTSDQVKIQDYYLNNFNKLEDMAYEYNWYND